MYLQPQHLEAAYELLRTTPPFHRWKLPSGEQIEFCIIHSESHSGDYFLNTKGHRIRMNAKWIGTCAKLLFVMAHEMLHLHLRIACPKIKDCHGKEFMRLARVICKHHGWSVTEF